MQMTTEARTWLDATVRRILALHPLGDPERAGVTYELMSHLHAAGEARAQKAGRTEVTREDLEAALGDAGGEVGLANAFVQPLSRPVERVLFWRRLGAFAVDALLILIAVGFVHGSVTMLFHPFVHGPAPVKPETGLWSLFPWGFHDTTLPVSLQAFIALASGGAVMLYFTWFEGHDGRTLGKRALDLRVLRTDGRPVTYRDAFLRNVAKLSPFILLLDTIMMLLVFGKDKQRISDRFAQTIVVKA
ncbi:MAG TPA: RDD family protein [Candidatus Thermoplasmatota archaeon]|nr:RDD family protein [Candidatus Thermoplasmatota archaeon]